VQFCSKSCIKISGIVKRILRDWSSGCIPASQYKLQLLQSVILVATISIFYIADMKINTRDLTGGVRSSLSLLWDSTNY